MHFLIFQGKFELLERNNEKWQPFEFKQSIKCKFIPILSGKMPPNPLSFMTMDSSSCLDTRGSVFGKRDPKFAQWGGKFGKGSLRFVKYHHRSKNRNLRFQKWGPRFTKRDLGHKNIPPKTRKRSPNFQKRHLPNLRTIPRFPKMGPRFAKRGPRFKKIPQVSEEKPWLATKLPQV